MVLTVDVAQFAGEPDEAEALPVPVVVFLGAMVEMATTTVLEFGGKWLILR